MAWMTRQDLAARGMTRAAIEAAVRTGALLRVGRGHYCTPDAEGALQRAVYVGGRLACVSELRRRGVWVLDDSRIHVRVPPTASRLRRVDDCVVHWEDDRSSRGASAQHVSGVDAVEGAMGCLSRRSAVATIDSALHLGVVFPSEIVALRQVVSSSAARILDLSDGRAESGLESIVRVLVVDLGFRVRSQVSFTGVGRVDLLVENHIVVETDGDEFHGAKVTTRDRRRDAALPARQLTVLHFRYAQVVYDLESVAVAVIAAVETHRRITNSGRKGTRARVRLARMDFS